MGRAEDGKQTRHHRPLNEARKYTRVRSAGKAFGFEFELDGMKLNFLAQRILSATACVLPFHDIDVVLVVNSRPISRDMEVTVHHVLKHHRALERATLSVECGMLSPDDTVRAPIAT